MLSIKRIKELAGDPDMTDEDAYAFRAAVYELAELSIELWELELKGEWRYEEYKNKVPKP